SWLRRGCRGKPGRRCKTPPPRSPLSRRRRSTTNGKRARGYRSARIGHGLEQRDLLLAAVRELVLARLTFGSPQQRLTERRLGRVHLDVPAAAFFAGGQQELLDLVVTLVANGQHHAWLGDPVVGWRFADLRRAQQLLEVTNASLGLALLFPGRVIAAVLPQVALFARGVDLGGNDRAF